MLKAGLVPLEHIERAILVLRGHRVLLDHDLAALYGVEVKVLKQAVRRNIERFPDDFMFALSMDEARSLEGGCSRSQSVTLNVEPYATTGLSAGAAKPARRRGIRSTTISFGQPPPHPSTPTAAASSGRRASSQLRNRQVKTQSSSANPLSWRCGRATSSPVIVGHPTRNEITRASDKVTVSRFDHGGLGG
jgi:hypothetical protein